MQELEQLQPEVPKKEALVTKCEKLVGDRQNRIDEIKDRIFADFSKEVPFDPPHFSKEVPFDPPPCLVSTCKLPGFTSSRAFFSQSCRPLQPPAALLAKSI